MASVIKMKKIISIVIAVILLFTMIAVVPSEAATRKTVRVGIFPLGQFQNIDENGKPYGYNVECLNKIAHITHWDIKYVKSENWVEATKQLDEGKIDLLAPAQATDALKSTYDFAANNMGLEFGAIYTLSKDNDILYEDFNAMSKLKYGIVTGSTFAKQFLNEYCPAAGFEPKYDEYENMTDLLDDLDKGKIDAAVTNVMFYNEKYDMLGHFQQMPVYYIAQKGDIQLLESLNTAMTSINMDEPSFQSSLLAKYFPVYYNTQLTYAEKQYIKNLPTISVGYFENHKPLSYTDSNGKFAGISRNILDNISKRTGIKFKYVALPNSDVDEKYLKENNISVICNLEYNDINATYKKLQLSTPYLSSEKVIVSKDDLQFNANSELTLATLYGSSTFEEIVKQRYPNFTVKKYNTIEECFAAVYNGEADILMENRYITTPLMSKPAYNGMSVVPVQNIEDELCVGTVYFGDSSNKTNALIFDGEFTGIIDKAIREITTEESNGYIISNTSENSYSMTFGDFIYLYKYYILAFAIILFVIGIFLVRTRKIKEDRSKALGIKNEQLSEAITQAEKANSAKSQFLARMSHEIRTPMNAIVGITAIAKSHMLEPEKMEDYLNKIESSSKVLLNIINDILDMSAIENQKLKIGHEPFDIKELLSEISNIYYVQCKNKGINFDMNVSEIETENLVGDALRLNQILLNIISNAYKFTPEGGSIKIKVIETQHNDKQIFFKFIVSDTGIGMSEEMVARLFKPFEQESTETAIKHGGSGLGLSIARNLVDLMQGAIQVSSQKGVGTTFTVDLPFEASTHSINRDISKLKAIRTLVVDDDANAREYTSLILDKIGVRYDVSNSGENALEMIKNAHDSGKGYDICFVDWKMPGLNGVSLSKRIREDFDDDTIIIIVSAYDLSEVKDEAIAAGANMFLPKPLFQSTVFNVLMNLSGGSIVNETASVDEYDFTGNKVLMAEDNALNSEIAVELLNMVNMKVDVATNGKEAVDTFNASEPGTYDLILMDIQMPIMNGLEAAQEIRKGSHPEGKTIPIYAMTANAFTEDIASALSAGMNGHIAKPIDTEILYRTIREGIKSK